MKFKSKILLSLLLLASTSSIFYLQSCKEEEPLAVKGNIEGTVSDEETRQSVEGVMVDIVSNSSTTFAKQSRQTGNDGKFSFKDLEAGNYRLSFSRSGYTENSKDVNILAGQTVSADLSLKPIKSAISVTPTSLIFGQTTSILPLEIRNTGKGELNWTIVADLPWLSINPISGKTTTESTPVTVSVDRTKVVGESQSGTFLVNSNGGSVIISVTVGKAGPLMNVTPASLDFGDVENEKSISVRNDGEGTLTFEAKADRSWITLENEQASITSGTKIIKVTVDRAGLSPTNYNGSIVITSNANTITVPLTMSVVVPAAPEVLNGQVSAITSTAAQVSGNVTSLGSSPVTQHGHCWSASPNPTTANNKTTLGGTNVVKSFTSNITGLNPNTTYYVKAYAENSIGISYSDAVSFTTSAAATMPTVETTGVANVKYNSIDANGNLTALGDGLVTDYGFCYSSSNAMPTVGNDKLSKGQTTQTGQYTATITNLQSSTKYYIRAYAANSMGTAYGSVVEATTSEAPSAPPVVMGGLAAYYTFDDGTVTDVTGNGWDGSAVNSPEFITDAPSEKGKAVFLRKANGTTVANDQRITIGNPIKDQTSYTVCLWVKDFGSGIILWGDTKENALYGTPSFHIKDGKLVVNNVGFDEASSLQDGQWHHIAICSQQYASGNVFYVDGLPYGSYSNTMRPTGATIQIGGAISNSYFSGNATNVKVDNIRFYDRVLSANEVKQIYDAKQ